MNKHRKIPEHQAVYERVRDQILLGQFAPGQQITIMGLSESLGVGMTPVREAMQEIIASTGAPSRTTTSPMFSISQISTMLPLVWEPAASAFSRLAGRTTHITL